MILPSGYETTNSLKYRSDGKFIAAAFEKKDFNEFIIAKIGALDGTLHILNLADHSDSMVYP